MKSKTRNGPFAMIKRSLQTHPSIFPNVYRVLEHAFLTNGNGYEVDKDGNLTCRASKNRLCITDEGLKWLAHDLVACDFYTIYPINSYEYEVKNGLGANRFYTDIYAYPAMNAEWQRAARWLLVQLLSRDGKWWKSHYSSLASNPALDGRGADYRRCYREMMRARKYLASFVKKFAIKLDECEARMWQYELLGHFDPEMRKLSS